MIFCSSPKLNGTEKGCVRQRTARKVRRKMFLFQSQLVAQGLIYWYCVFMVFLLLPSLNRWFIPCVHYFHSTNERLRKTERPIANRFHWGWKRSTESIWRSFRIGSQDNKWTLNGKMMTCWHAWNVNDSFTFFLASKRSSFSCLRFYFFCFFNKNFRSSMSFGYLTIIASKTDSERRLLRFQFKISEQISPQTLYLINFYCVVISVYVSIREEILPIVIWSG